MFDISMIINTRCTRRTRCDPNAASTTRVFAFVYRSSTELNARPCPSGRFFPEAGGRGGVQTPCWITRAKTAAGTNTLLLFAYTRRATSVQRVSPMTKHASYTMAHHDTK